MTKVVMLDIDGPLVNHRTHLARNGSRQVMRDFDPIGVGLINRLCAESGAVIVISSTWRLFHGKPREMVLGKECDDPSDPFDIMKHLHSVGITAPFHTDWRTFARGFSWSRGMEIRDWLDDHLDTTHWCAIDDSCDFGEDMMPNLVQVSFDNGIMLEDYRKAKKLLGVGI